MSTTAVTRLGMTVFVFLSIAVAGPALAVPISYSDTKTWSFTSNVQGAVPVVTGKRFTHAINRGTTIAENSANQPQGFDGFRPEEVFYKAAPGGGKQLAITNGTGPTFSGINMQTISPLPLGVTTQTSSAGDADATTTFDVAALAAPTASGTLLVSGNAPENAAKKTGYAFSYGNVSATVGGRNLSGNATVMSSGVKLQSTTIQAHRLGPGVKDPLNFTVTDTSDTILLSQTLYLFTADVDGGGELTWDNSLLTVTAGTLGQNAYFELDISPLSGAASNLILQVIDGIVAAETATGPLFSSLLLPGLGTTGNFSLAVASQVNFSYDLSKFGSQLINATAQWDTAGYTSAVPEPSTLAFFVTGAIGLLANGWRQKLTVGKPGPDSD